MHFIWFNPDHNEYKYGNTVDFNGDIESAENPKAYTVLMEFDAEAKNLADKIILELNIANTQSVVKLAS